MKCKLFIIFTILFVFSALAGPVLAQTRPIFSDPLHPTGGGGISGFEDMLINIMRWLWPISVVIAVLMVLIGAYYFVFSGGDPRRVATAKKVVILALVGLAIVTAAIGIWELIKLILGI